jgi:glyoxylase-like metal-dependent hydrolase (beta-lactamase superfamily II)
MAFDVYPFTVGHARCHALKDSESEGSTADAFRHDDPEAFARAAQRHGIDLERITLAYTCLLIDLGGARVLIDSGAGGALFDHLAGLEIDPASIDALVLSHAHMDHYGGHLDADGGKRFPNARYLMWGGEWERYSSEEHLARERKRLGERFAAIERYFLPLNAHLELLDSTNPEIIPGITAVPAPGHSHHHMAIELVSGRETLLFVAATGVSSPTPTPSRRPPPAAASPTGRWPTTRC